MSAPALELPEPDRVLVTVEMAKYLLSRNSDNRRMDMTQAVQIAALMKQGRWDDHPQPVMLDDDDNVLDGQHRLMAIVLADRPCPLIVIRGTREARALVDIGRLRAIKDQVGFVTGRAVHSDIGPLASSVMMYQRSPGKVWGGPTLPGKVERQDFVIAHLPELEAARSESLAASRVLPKSKPALPVVYYLNNALAQDPTVVPAFMEGLISGVGLTQGDPRLALRNSQIMTVGTTGVHAHTHWDKQMRIAILLGAIDKWINGKKVHMVRYARSYLPMPEVTW